MKLRFRILFIVSMFAAAAQAAGASPCSFAGSRQTPQVKILTCTVDGVKRRALVYAPALAIKGHSLPVVFAFHGHGGSMQGASQSMHLQTLWPAAIVVYAQGLPGTSGNDEEGEKPGWQQEAGQNGDRDLNFFDAMLTTMQQEYAVDNTRIYVTGFSNGGAFSFLLWAERGNTLAAIGAVAGRTRDSVHLTQPRAFLAIAGENDKKMIDGEPRIALQKKSIKKAQKVDSAPDPSQNCVPPSGAAPGTRCNLYPSATQTPVKTFIHPGGHVYPAWATAEIVKFFKAHKQV